MKKILSKSHWLIAKHGISLVAVFAVLVVAFVAIAPDLSFGWFSQNNQVSAKGMTVQADHPDFDIYCRQSDSAEWVLVSIDDPSSLNIVGNLTSPGVSITFQIMIKNKGQRTVTLTEFGIAAPATGEDAPNAKGKHLCGELATTVSKVGCYNETSKTVDAISGVSLATKLPVLHLPTAGELPNVTLEGKVDYMTYLAEDSAAVSVPSGSNVVFEIRVAFLNRDEDQNDFKNFGKVPDGGTTPDGVCLRRLYFTYTE
jgi:hypothetical protein